jgi:methylmalonyl-CoA carboxyltransferase small subunit
LKLRITIDGKVYEAEVEILEDEDSEHPYVPFTPAPVSYTPPPLPIVPAVPAGVIDTGADHDKVCRSPVTGLVIKVSVEPGQTVEAGDVLVVLESMKMENNVTATHTATVKSVNAVPGSSVKVHQPLLEFE